jgi:hypothetical protein
MTRRKDLPHEAKQPPTIRSPEEDAERAARRQEQEVQSAKERRHLADTDNPLRMPGELEPRPDEEPTDERPERAREDDDESV